MLSLRRKINQSVWLIWPDGRTARIKITGLGRWRAQLGIEAPEECVILREELICESDMPSPRRPDYNTGAA